MSEATTLLGGPGDGAITHVGDAYTGNVYVALPIPLSWAGGATLIRPTSGRVAVYARRERGGRFWFSGEEDA